MLLESLRKKGLQPGRHNRRQANDRIGIMESPMLGSC
jgi:hypothetical protein